MTNEKATVASVNEKAKSAHERLNTECETQEKYRVAVHNRIDRIHDMYNKLIEADNGAARRLDVVEHSLVNVDKVVDKVVDELKTFGEAINKLSITTAVQTAIMTVYTGVVLFMGTKFLDWW